MDVATGANSKTSPKPLGQLGRDEMNLAEFPITLLTDRVPKDQREVVYQDEIFDDKTGLTLTRKLTIQAGNCGLTTAIDDEVILALIQLTKRKNNFTQRKVEFTRLELIQILGWINAGNNYERIKTSLDRWTSVYLRYENAWRDNRTKTWTTKGFHIIEMFEINDSRTSIDQLDLLSSYIIWNEVIFESFQAGYLKPLDYDLCMGLSNSTAKRMYRFLDKRFHHKQDWLFDLKELAHEHIGLGRNYDGPAHLKRKLLPALAELETIGFIAPLPEAERFVKDGKDWKIRLIQKSAVAVALPKATPAPPIIPPLVAELIKRGVSDKTAADLVSKHLADAIQAKLDAFDWLVESKDKRIGKSPEGYLVKSICDDYKAPKGFVSAAQRHQQQEARQAREQAEAAERRRQREEEAHEKAERNAIDAYWNALTPEQQAELQTAADAQADPASLAQEYGPLKRMGRQIRRMAYIRQILQQETAPA
jgi:hypothetical protein